MTKKNTYSLRHLDAVLQIETDITEKKGIYTSYIIHLELQEQGLILKAKKRTYDSVKEKINEEAIALEDYGNSIKKKIYTYVNSSFNEGFYITDASDVNPFLDKMGELQRNSILRHLGNEESVLACLEIQNCKGDINLPKKSDTYLLITSKRTCILVYGHTDGIIDISTQTLTHKAELGRDTILGESFTCQTALFNDNLFEELQYILKHAEPDRVEKFNDILFTKNPKEPKAISLIQKAYLKAATESGSLKPKLKQALVSTFLPEEKKHAFNIAKLKTFLEAIEKEPTAGQVLSQVFKEWEVSAEKQYLFLEFLLPLKIKNSIHMTLWVEDILAFKCLKEKKLDQNHWF